MTDEELKIMQMTDEELEEAQFSLATKQFGDAICRFAKFGIADGGINKAAFMESVRRTAAEAFDIENQERGLEIRSYKAGIKSASQTRTPPT